MIAIVYCASGPSLCFPLLNLEMMCLLLKPSMEGLQDEGVGACADPQLNGKLRSNDDLWITGVALVGTLIGQVSLACR